MSKHDLHFFMNQLSKKMKLEYERIRQHSSQDPGTAGDEGESDWAELLQGWLPPHYKVVTKGQLIDINGALSPQVDIIVLKPNYPPFLYDKKKYLLSGVLAVFECKLRLRKNDINKFFKNSLHIKSMSRKRIGTAYKELFSQPLYGLLCHTSDWTNPIEIVNNHIREADKKYITHPRETPDIICIADAAVWTTSKSPNNAWYSDEAREDSEGNIIGVPSTAYMCNSESSFFGEKQENFNAIGFLFTALYLKLSLEDKAFTDMAHYFFNIGFSWASSGPSRNWSFDVFSDEVINKLMKADFSEKFTPRAEWQNSYD